jgi:hypothetical protein
LATLKKSKVATEDTAPASASTKPNKKKQRTPAKEMFAVLQATRVGDKEKRGLKQRDFLRF